MTKPTTLSRRGAELAAGDSLVELAKVVFGDVYDPETNPDGLINMGVAENYAMLPEMAEHIKGKIDLSKHDFAYGLFWGLQKAMAKFMTNNFDPYKPIDPSNILFASGGTSVFEDLGFTLFDEGDGILLGRPFYQAFPKDFGLKARVTSVYVSFDDIDQFTADAAAPYEQALLAAEARGTRIRALMLCNPHNPLGRCYTKDAIIALMKLCQKYSVHLIADQIYAASVYEVPDKQAVPFTSVLSFDYTQYISKELLHVVYGESDSWHTLNAGLSKDVAGGGLRIGCLLSENKDLRQATVNITQFVGLGGPSSAVTLAILEDEEFLAKYKALSQKRLSAANKLTRRVFDEMGISYSPGANAGFFLWADLSQWLPKGSHFKDDWEREAAFLKSMLGHKLLFTNGQQLGAARAGFFRVIFSSDPATLRVGFKRLAKLLGVKEPKVLGQDEVWVNKD